MTVHVVTRQDIAEARSVLARAFHHDPLWVHVVPDAVERARLLPHAFEVSLRLGMRHGEVFAPSPGLEGIATWLPGERSAFSFWSVLRSGGLGAGLKVGLRHGAALQRLTTGVETYRKNAVPKPFMYLAVLGVDPARQGQGLGSLLLRHMLARTDTASLPVYLETETEDNVRFYEKHGFTVMDTISEPGSPVTFWGRLTVH